MIRSSTPTVERGFLDEIIYPDPDGTGPLERREAGFIYDATGNLITQQVAHDSAEARGTTVTTTYDAAGRPIRKSYPVFGMQTTYEYDNLGRLTGEYEQGGLHTTFAYDAVGRITLQSQGSELEQSPAETHFGYDAAGQLTSVTDARGYTTNYEYDSRGLVTSVTLPDPDGTGPLFGQTTFFRYDDIGRLTHEFGTFTRLTEWEHDSRNRITKITLSDPEDQGESTRPVYEYAYDAVGNLLSEIDPLGNSTAYTHDKEGRVTSVTSPDPDGAGPLASSVAYFGYSTAGLLTSTTDPKGNTTTFVYDNLGRVTEEAGADPDGFGPAASPVSGFEYNKFGKLAKFTDPAYRTTTFDYDWMGRRIGSTDSLGNTTTYQYDNFSNLKVVTEPDPDGPGPLSAPETSYNYDVFGRTTRITDAENGRTNFTYDAVGNLLTLKDAENNTTTFAYDGVNRLTMETNQRGDSRSYQYDAEGNLSQKVDRNGRIVQYQFDNLDRMTGESWYSGSSLPSLTVTTDSDGGNQNEVQRVGYSGFVYGGMLTLALAGETTSPLSATASAQEVEAALESLPSIGSGNIAVTKSDNFAENIWTLNFQGALAGADVNQVTIDTSSLFGFGLVEIEETLSDGGNFNEVQTIELSDASGGTFRLGFSGETTAPLDYDAGASEVESALESLNSVDNVTVTSTSSSTWTVTFGGNQTGLDLPELMGDASGATGGTLLRSFDFAYDKAGQLLSASDPDSSYTYTYDNLGQVLTVDNGGTAGVPQVVLNSAYDHNGNRTGLAATIDGIDDFQNSYAYDGLNRLTRLEQIGTLGGNAVADKRVDFSYLIDGRYDSIARYNDIAGGASHEVATSNYSYDVLGRLAELDYQQGGTDLLTPYNWNYDDLNRISQFSSADGITVYDYDLTNQVTGANHTYQTDEVYSYDKTGNRTNLGHDTAADNRLTSDGTYSYTYDDEGNRTNRVHNFTGEETIYDWDYRNRLVSVTEKDAMGSTTK
ncbi:MAG: hypothetical protein AAF483_15525, partial [Planctomycetota bacterium]